MYRKIFCILLLVHVWLLPEGFAGTLQVYTREGKCLLDLPRSLFGRVFLGVSRLDSVGECRTYQPGSRLGKEIAISFRQGKPGAVDVYLLHDLQGGGSSSPEMKRLLERNGVEFPVINCPVVKEGTENVVIDVTRVMERSEPFFDAPGKRIVRSEGDGEGFSCTVMRELAVVRRQWKRDNDVMTELPVTTTFFLLPEQPREARTRDRRVGFSSVSYDYFKDESTGARTRYVVKRWALEPRDREAYRNGAATEPVEPIVFYLDPAIPARWKPYFVQAVEDWQRAFERAGFRKAIVARDIPKGKEQSLASLRAVILYQDSLRGEAVDVNVDPRSGQIIQARVHWSPGMLDSLKRECLVKSALSNCRSIPGQEDEQITGHLIRVTVGCGVGEALGLQPNRLASAWIPEEKLRNDSWLTENGMSSSIMGDVVVNTVAQPEDRVSVENMFPRVGSYDCWAIDWGYRCRGEVSGEKEPRGFLLENVKRRECWWSGCNASPEIVKADANLGNLGSDAAASVGYVLGNVKRVFESAGLVGEGHDVKVWVRDSGVITEMLYETVLPVLRQFGGIGMLPEESLEYLPAPTPVARVCQEKAMELLNREVFTTPRWLMQSVLIKKAGLSSSDVIAAWQSRVLECLFDERMPRFALNNEMSGKNSPYTLDEFLDGLRRGVWTGFGDVDPCKDTLRMKYLEIVEKTLKKPLWNGESVALQVHLKKLQADLNDELSGTVRGEKRDRLTRYKIKIEDVIKKL